MKWYSSEYRTRRKIKWWWISQKQILEWLFLQITFKCFNSCLFSCFSTRWHKPVAEWSAVQFWDFPKIPRRMNILSIFQTNYQLTFMGWDCSIDSSISEFLVYPLSFIICAASSLHYHNNQEFTVYTSLLKIPPAYQYNPEM